MTEVIGNLAPTASSDPSPITYADPVMISMIRHTMPNLMAYDVCGVQPMTGPTGLIFAMRAKYDTQDGTDTMYNEPDTRHSGDAGSEGSAGTAGTAGAVGGAIKGFGSDLDMVGGYITDF